MQHEELMERVSLLGDGNAWPSTIELINDLADALQSQAARIAALIAAGDKLAGFAAHDSECALGLHGPACSCGLTTARQAWREARDEPA